MWSTSTFVLVILVSLMIGNGSSRTTLPTTPGLPAASSQVIESFHVKSDIRYRFATTKMISVVRNTALEAQEISFEVTLPKEAFIVSFSMFIEGVEYPGEVKEKSEAKRQYQAAVDRGQSAGHVRQAPRHANVFQVSVNVAAGQAVNFTLSYQEVLRRKLGLYEHEVHVSPGMPVKDFLMEVHIQENRPLTFVKTPALRENVLITNSVEEDNALTVIDRPSAESAHVIFRPSVQEQGKSGVDARFAVQYDVEHGKKGDVLVVDGYFIHLFSPDLPSLPKDIIFVLDVSGSMSGEKMSQLKEAMETILDDLQPSDRFNILAFSSKVHKWRPQLVEVNDEGMSEARLHIQSMRAEGSTNINEALLTAVQELQTIEREGRVSMIFFLTDGVPTTGVTSASQIARNVRNVNENAALIFALAFGSGADYDSLKTISIQNSGFARKIYLGSDADLQVTSLYREISTVALKNVKIQYMPSSVDEFSITEHDFPVVFNGSEIIVCGRMAEGAEEIGLEITARQKYGEITLVMEAEEISNFILTDETADEFYQGPRDYAGFVEKMWAYLTIKQMLKEKDALENDDSKATELKEKIINMSLKYKLVTPLTSMVVTKPDKEPDTLKEADLETADDLPSQASSIGRGQTARRRKYRPSRNRGSSFSKQYMQHSHYAPSSVQNQYNAPGLAALPPWATSGRRYTHPYLAGTTRTTTTSRYHYAFTTTTTPATTTSAYITKTSPPPKSTFPTYGSSSSMSSTSLSSVNPDSTRPHSTKEPGRASFTSTRPHSTKEPGRASFTSTRPHSTKEPGRASFTSTRPHSTKEPGRASYSSTRPHSTKEPGRALFTSKPVTPHGVTSRMTSTPIASFTSSTPVKKPSNEKNKKSKRGALLVAMVGRMNNSSVCLAPKKVTQGRYILMDSLNLNGSRVEVQTSCSGRTCKGVYLSSVHVTSPTGFLTVTYTPGSGKSWSASNTSEPGAVLTIRGRSFSLKGNGFTMSVNRVGRPRLRRYILEITIEKPARGLLGDAVAQYRPRPRHKTRKVPEPCRGTNAAINKSLRNRGAKKYKFHA